MTNLVFVEPKTSYKQNLKQELQEYAISVALKFPTQSISVEHKIKVAKFSVRDLLKRFDLSTKNFGALIHDEVISNLQKVYFKIKKKTLNYHFLTRSNKELQEMIKIVKLLRSSHPKKYKRIFKSLQNQLSDRQSLIFNIYFKFKPSKRKKKLTYQTVSKLSKTSPGTITGDVKKVVQSLTKIFKSQRISRGRTK